MLAVKKVFMISHYKSVVQGFSDTLPALTKCNKENGKGKNKLENLARSLQINCDKAHNAVADVRMLRNVLLKCNISDEKLKECCVSWSTIEEQEAFKDQLPGELNKLKVLNKCTSLLIRKKIVAAGISYDMIINAYKQNKFVEVSSLLGKNEEGFIRVTTNKQVLTKLCDFLESLLNNNIS